SRGVLRDMVALWPLAVLVLWATRSFVRMQVLLLLLAALFGLGQLASLSMLGSPLRLTDVLALPTLFMVMATGPKIAVVAGVALAVVLLLWLLRPRWPRLPA